MTVRADDVVPTVVDGKLSDVGDRLTTGAGGLAPVPESDSVCGEPVTLSAMLMEAVLVPAAVGLNATEIVQVPDAATDVPQVLVWMKSPVLEPANESAIPVSDAVPEFVRVTVWVADVDPTVVLVKVSDAGLRETLGAAAATAVPETGMLCGEPVALSVIVKEDERVPAAVGLNVTAMAQDAPTAKLDPQLLDWL